MALRGPKNCFVKEGFKLAAKTGYGRTVSNVQGKGIPNDGSSYRKNWEKRGNAINRPIIANYSDTEINKQIRSRKLITQTLKTFWKHSVAQNLTHSK